MVEMTTEHFMQTGFECPFVATIEAQAISSFIDKFGNPTDAGTEDGRAKT